MGNHASQLRIQDVNQLGVKRDAPNTPKKNNQSPHKDSHGHLNRPDSPTPSLIKSSRSLGASGSSTVSSPESSPNGDKTPWMSGSTPATAADGTLSPEEKGLSVRFSVDSLTTSDGSVSYGTPKSSIGTSSTAETAVVSPGGTFVKASRLQENLMRCQKRDPFLIYDFVSVMGKGSMGSVCRVKKNASAVGGSSRAAFVEQRRVEDQQQEVGPCFHGCSFMLETFRRHFFDSLSRDDLALSIPEEEGRRPKTRDTCHASLSDSDNTAIDKHERYYALKSLHLERCTNQTLKKELRNEVAILKELDHPHIAKAFETYEFEGRLYICLELCSGGDLYSRDPYSEKDAAQILAGIMSAVAYLHSKGIVHRDLKYENIMFEDSRPEAAVKLIDFGLSSKFAPDEEFEDSVGTVYSMAPELIAGQYNSKADVWSVGVIAYMLLSSSMPFYGKSRYEVMKRIIKGKLKFSGQSWQVVSYYGKGVVRQLMQYDQSKRPFADVALKMIKSWQQNLAQGSPDELQSTPSPLTFKTQPSALSSEAEMEMMDRIQASIHSFSQYSTLKKLAMMVIAYKSTASEIGWLREHFAQFDLFQNGEISLKELTDALKETYDYNEGEIQALFTGMDIDGTGNVHYTEFVAAALEAHGPIDETRIADAFDRIDCDDSGYITIQNLRDFLGDDVPESYLERIIEDADIEKDKRISYAEFLELWNSSSDSEMQLNVSQVSGRRMRHVDSFQTCLADRRTDSDQYLLVRDDDLYGEEFLTSINNNDREGREEPEMTLVPHGNMDGHVHPSNHAAADSDETFTSQDCFYQRKEQSTRAFDKL